MIFHQRGTKKPKGQVNQWILRTLVVVTIGTLVARDYGGLDYGDMYALNNELIATTSSADSSSDTKRRLGGHGHLRNCFDNVFSEIDSATKSDATEQERSKREAPQIVRSPPCRGLKTLDEALSLTELPCNYAHDGYYLMDSNVMVTEVYQSLQRLWDETEASGKDPTKIIPIVAEIGGHDGITKSLSLKTSRCLHTNTLLIEASKDNYKTLQKSRAYDTTVFAALCDPTKGDGFVELQADAVNSGKNMVVKESNEKTVRVPCTTLDDEIEAMKATLPDGGFGYELKFLFLVLDVEGHEVEATQGIQRHVPSKAMIETSPETKTAVQEWAHQHGLPKGFKCGTSRQDLCFNFEVRTEGGVNQGHFPPHVFYGARKTIPKQTHQTSEMKQFYMHYGRPKGKRCGYMGWYKCTQNGADADVATT